MTQNINSFVQTVEVGDLDLQEISSVLTCMVNPGSSSTIIPGQAVKLANVAKGGVPKVIPLAANTDPTFGFAVRNLKDANFTDGKAVEIAWGGSVMYMTAGAAINPGAKVEVVYTTNKVITAAGTNPMVGFALDKATADLDIIRVLLRTPGNTLAV
jgi:hypothetical protein